MKTDTKTPDLSSLRDILFLYINLDRSVDRRAHMETLLQASGVTYQRVTGIDGAKVFAGYGQAEKNRFLRHHGRHMRAGELGCYESHLKAMQVFLESDYDYAVIMEDDALFVGGGHALKTALQPGNRPHWDLLRLQTRRKLMLLPITPLSEDATLSVNTTRSTGATAYALNRKAADTLRQALRPIEVPFDHAFDQPHRFGLKYRHLSPPGVSPAGHDSTIEVSPVKKGRPLATLTKLLWRTKTETSRFVWSLGEWLRAATKRKG